MTGRKARLPAVPFVLMYHSVAAHGPDPCRSTVSPSRFARQMRWLAHRGLRGASVRELLDGPAGGRGTGMVGLSFDDGYADFVTEALPVLVEHRFTATVFVLAGRIGGYDGWASQGMRRPLMSAEQVREVAAGGIEIGSHGLRPRDLRAIGPVELSEEIWHSRDLLYELLGRPVDGFSYPGGTLPSGVDRTVNAAGYSYACAQWANARRDRFALPRTPVGERDVAPALFAKQIRHWLAWGGWPG